MNTKLTPMGGLVGLVLRAAACGGEGDPAPLPIGTGDLSQALAAKTGASILTLRDEKGNAYGYVATDDGHPVAPPHAGESDMRAFLATFGDELPLGAAARSAPGLGDMGGTGGAAIRLRKVVPGTEVPLLDESLSLGLREDGSFAFLATGTSELGALDLTATIDEKSAMQAALARAGQNATIPGAPELGVTTRTDPARLVYRLDIADDEGSLRVDVDAKSGAIVAEGRTDVHALAYAAESYLNGLNDRSVPQATLECSVKNGKLVRDTRGGTVEVFDERSRAAITATSFGADAWVADTNIPSGAPANYAPGIAVNAQYHVGNAATFFANTLVGTFGGRDGRIPVYVHNRLESAFGEYVPALNAIAVTDGIATTASNAPSPVYSRYPAAMAYDMMAHEYAHGLLHNRGLSAPSTATAFRSEAAYVEAKAIHEGLADVFAMAAEGAGGQIPWNAAVLSFGEGALPRSSAPYRNHLHPKAALADQMTTGHTTEPYPTPTGRPDQVANRRGYFRSGLVSHAFALMAYGGANETSFVGVEAPLGMSPAFYAFALGSMFLGKDATILDLAHATVGALAVPSHRANAACAWVAVGVLSPGDAMSRYGATCRNFSGSTCAGMADGTYCNAKTTTASYVCRNGQVAGGNTCRTGLYCQRRGGSFASPALLDVSGSARCGAEMDPFGP
ncbi:MAG: PepSY domain-containing protein [Myxococcales bacterium]|nr:PepSY domain-containing protein [Myxococcales bacterium]